jgi:GNAT superfamily N-acetyltransferase
MSGSSKYNFHISTFTQLAADPVLKSGVRQIYAAFFGNFTGKAFIRGKRLYKRNMIHYREAAGKDVANIAGLHALSWQLHYRGILRDEFLDSQVQQNRLELWQSRFQQPEETQYVVVAEDGNKLCGFACLFARADPVWGALVDNLHVLAPQKGQGIGSGLMQRAAAWAYTNYRHTGLYLWVYTGNTRARGFYEKIGGVNVEEVLEECPGGGKALICRYVWKDITKLMELT